MEKVLNCPGFVQHAPWHLFLHRSDGQWKKTVPFQSHITTCWVQSVHVLRLFLIWVVATQILFIFTPKIGEDEPILTIIFFKGVGEKPPTSCWRTYTSWIFLESLEWVVSKWVKTILDLKNPGISSHSRGLEIPESFYTDETTPPFLEGLTILRV